MSTLAADRGRESRQPSVDRETVSYEIVANPRAFEDLKRDWDALYDRAAQPYFSQSFTWCWTSWQIVSQARGRKLHCLVGRQDRRVVLIWPFVRHRLGAWSVLRPLGPETTEYGCVLVEDGADALERIASAWNVVCATSRSDVIMVPLVPAGPLQLCLSAATAYAFRDIDHTAYVSRSKYASWEAYRSSLPNDMRKNIARRRRRLEEKGKLLFETIGEPDRCEPVIDWILRQKHRWLTETKIDNPWLRTREYRDFLVALTKGSDPRGGIVAAVLRLDDEIIAADVFRRDAIRIEDFLTAFAPEFAAYGPGQMILEECLKWAFENRLDFDFRIGSESYKTLWTNEHGLTFSYEFANSLWGSAYVAYRKAGWHARQLRLLVPPSWRRRIKTALRRKRR